MLKAFLYRVHEKHWIIWILELVSLLISMAICGINTFLLHILGGKQMGDRKWQKPQSKAQITDAPITEAESKVSPETV